MYLTATTNVKNTCCIFLPWFTYSRPTLILGFTRDFPKSVCEIDSKNETLSNSGDNGFNERKLNFNNNQNE